MAEQKAKLAGRSAYIVTGGQIVPVRIQAVGERQILVKSYSTGAMTQHVKDDVYLFLSQAVSALITSEGNEECCSVCGWKGSVTERAFWQCPECRSIHDRDKNRCRDVLGQFAAERWD